MGGSSLCPEVMARDLRPVPGLPELLVLDSTDPAQVQRPSRTRSTSAKTLFIVSSKSGSHARAQHLQGLLLRAGEARRWGRQGGPATSSPSPIPARSWRRRRSERRLPRTSSPGVPSIGGRYSALSNFGMVPAGGDGPRRAQRLLDSAERMVDACAPGVPAEENPGLVLGAILGTLAATRGPDKVTLVASPGIRDLGRVARAAARRVDGQGRQGHHPGRPRARWARRTVYGDDRLFAYLRLEAAPDSAQDAARRRAGEGRATRSCASRSPSRMRPGRRSSFRWEIATAVAGSILGINPFDQPDVEASKIATREAHRGVREDRARFPRSRPSSRARA